MGSVLFKSISAQQCKIVSSDDRHSEKIASLFFLAFLRLRKSFQRGAAPLTPAESPLPLRSAPCLCATGTRRPFIKGWRKFHVCSVLHFFQSVKHSFPQRQQIRCGNGILCIAHGFHSGVFQNQPLYRLASRVRFQRLQGAQIGQALALHFRAQGGQRLAVRAGIDEESVPSNGSGRFPGNTFSSEDARKNSTPGIQNSSLFRRVRGGSHLLSLCHKRLPLI